MSSAASRLPDGIDKQLAAAAKRRRRPNPAPLILLFLLLTAALLGLLAGHPNPDWIANGAGARLVVNSPRVIRNGEFFEARIAVAAHQPIEKLTIAVTPELWRELTLDGSMPEASEQSYEKGLYRLQYGRLKAGEEFHLKLDFYLHPSLFGRTKGTYYVLDGDRPLVDRTVSMLVLP